jgi:hypothetical protein
MSVYSKILSLINGVPRTIDFSEVGNTLGVSAIQLDGSTSGSITLSASATTTPYSVLFPPAQGAVSSVLQNDGSGNLSWGIISSTPAISNVFTAGENFAANTSFIVRWAMNVLSETTDTVYKADYSTVSYDEFWGIGIAFSTTAVTAGQNITVYSFGSYTLGSNDTPFSTSNTGDPVWLTTAGAFSVVAPSGSSEADLKIGIVMSTTQIWIDGQMMGIGSSTGGGPVPLNVVEGGTGVASFTPYAVIVGGVTSTDPLQQVVGVGTTGQVLTSNGASALPTWQTSGAGSVTSVALADGSTAPIYGITGSPVTSSGTLTFTLNTQSANTIFAGPSSGSAAQPAFRAIVAADIPTLNQNTTGTSANVTGTVAIANGGTGQTTQQSAINALTGSQTAGYYLRSDGTNATLSAIQVADVPTLNQNTTGTAANITATSNATLATISSLASVGTITSGTWNATTIAIAHGGTGQTSASSAFNALSPITSTGDLIVGNGTNSATRLAIGSNGYVLSSNGTTAVWTAPAATGVTSVAFADDSTTPIYSVSGSPVTSTGTLAITLSTQSANTVFAGPTSGSAAQPTFRSLVAADIPSLSATYVTQSEVGANNGVASLDGGGKVPLSQLPATLMEFKGSWNPNTNTPTLADGTGTTGFTYWVSAADSGTVAGLTDPSMTNFQIGDLVIYNGTKWVLVTPAAGVQSVNGAQGAVTVNAISSLTGDVTTATASGSQSEAATVAFVGGSSAAAVNTATVLVNTSQSGNLFLASPNGSSGAPSFRAIVAADIPTLNQNTTGTAANITATSNATLTTLSALTTASSLASVGTITSGTWNGTTIAIAHGGTGQTTAAAAFNALNPMTTTGDITYESATNTASRLAIGSAGKVLTVVSGIPAWAAPATSGTVTSVALADGSTTPIYNISNSPVTSSGTLTFTLATQTANTVFAGPSSGSAAQPTFRSLVSADIPNNAANTTGTAANVTGTVAIAHGGTGQTTAAAAYNALSPMTTTGDIEYESSTNTASRLGIGSTGQVLTVVSGVPAWSTPVSLTVFYPPTAQTFTTGGSSGTYNLNYSFSITSGNATVGATYTNNGVTFTVYATVSSATIVVMSGSGAPTASGTLTKSSGTGDSTITFSAFRAPLYLEVVMVGGGGGGSGSGSSVSTAGGTGGQTYFGSSFLIANGGGGGPVNMSGPSTPGSASKASPAVGTAVTGSAGSPGYYITSTTYNQGGSGGSSALGGGGGGGNAGGGPSAGAANTGSGGGGGGQAGNTSGYYSGTGGASGGFVSVVVPNPSPTYSYGVGTAGSAGPAGSGGTSQAGAAGGTGYLQVTEKYQ